VAAPAKEPAKAAAPATKGPEESAKAAAAAPKSSEEPAKTAAPVSKSTVEPAKATVESTKAAASPPKTPMEAAKTAVFPPKDTGEPSKVGTESAKAAAEPTKAAAEPAKAAADGARASAEPFKFTAELAKASSEPAKATTQLYELAFVQAENGSIGNAENTSWSAVALVAGDRPELLAAAGRAVRWLASQEALDDSELALSAYAQAIYERRYLEVRDSFGDALPRPPSMAGQARMDGRAPALEAPYWLGPLGTLLLTIGAVGLFARLRTEDRILSGARHRILEYLRNEPGQDQAGIQRDLEMSTGSAVYNLSVLSDKGYLTVHRDGRHKRYYVNGNALRPVANGMTKYIVSALRNVNTKRMAMYLLERPGAAQKEVSEGLSLDPSTVHWHAERLKKVGVLSSMREGRNVAYRIERPEIICQILSFIP